MQKPNEKPEEVEEIEEIEEPEEIEEKPPEEKAEKPKGKKPKATKLFNPMEGVPDPDAGREIAEVKKGLSDLGSKIDQLLSGKPEKLEKPEKPIKKVEKQEKESSAGRWFDEFELFPEI